MNLSSIPSVGGASISDFAARGKTDDSIDFLSQLQSSIDSGSRPEGAPAVTGDSSGEGGADPLREAFQDFVGNTLYGQMLKSMRSTLQKPAYMHGGKTEEIFQQQLDQILVEDLTDKSADTIADPMFELFNLRRQ
jgi:hypothetical protein